MNGAAPPTRRPWRMGLLLLLLVPLVYVLYRQRQAIDAERRAVEEARQQKDAELAAERQRWNPLVPDPFVPAAFPNRPEDGTPPTSQEVLARLEQQAREAEPEFLQRFGASGERRYRYRPPARTLVQKEVQEQYLQYWLRDVTTYRELTQDRQEIRPIAEEFLTALSKWRVAHPESLHRFQVRELGVDALVAGSRDPIVLTGYVELVHEFESNEMVLGQLILKGLQSLAGTSYPARFEFRLRIILQEMGIMHPGMAISVSMTRRNDALMATIQNWLREETRSKESLRFLYTILDHNELRTPEILARLGDDPEIDPWLRHMIAGDVLFYEAWAARGNDFAANVKPENMAKFDQLMDRAKRHYRQTWLLHPEHPRGATRMIDCSRATGDDGRTPADWMRHAVAAQLDAVPAYGAYRLAKESRWGGSPEELLDFARECLACERYDTVVPFTLLEVIEDLQNREDIPIAEQLNKYPVLEELLTTFLAGRAAWKGQPTPVHQAAGFPEFPWRVYYEGGRWTEAHKIATENPEVPRAFWLTRKHALPGRYEWDLSRASSEPVRELVTRLDTRVRLAPLDQLDPAAIAEIQADLADLRARGPADHAAPALARFETLLAQRQAWNSGDWVSLLDGPDANGCEFFADEVIHDADTNTWRLVSNGNQYWQVGLTPLLPFAPPLEVECQLEVQRGNPGIDFVGIYWREPPGVPVPEREDWVAFMKPHPFFGATSKRFPDAMVPSPDPQFVNNQIGLGTPRGPIPYRLLLWPRWFEFQVQSHSYSRPLLQDLDPKGRLFLGEPTYAIGWRAGKYPVGTLSFRKVRLRRVTSPPAPPETAPAAERVAYWEQRHKADSEHPIVVWEFARALCDTDPERAVSLARQAQQQDPQSNLGREVLGLGLLKLGRPEEALTEFGAAIRKDSTRTVGALLGWCDAGLALPAASSDQLRQITSNFLPAAEALGADRVRLRSIKAEARFREGEIEDALNCIQEAIRWAPTDDPRLPELKARFDSYRKTKATPKPGT